jgi:ABC-type phosphate/phosphonate transport system ATPase subunit
MLNFSLNFLVNESQTFYISMYDCLMHFIGCPRKEEKALTQHTLEQVGLEKFSHLMVNELSGVFLGYSKGVNII